MKKTALLSILFATYLGLMAVINVIHFRYFNVDVVFYAALGDAALAAAVTTIAAALARRLTTPESTLGSLVHNLTAAEMALSILCAVLMGYIVAISIPTVIDRSLSIYILEKLEQRGGAIALEAMSEIIAREYVSEHRLVDARMTEQLESETIAIEDGCVRITPRGRRITAFTRFYRIHMLPKKRLLMGEFTSDLTDPFRHPAPAVDYRCREDISGAVAGHSELAKPKD